jgi:hypothetical protein
VACVQDGFNSAMDIFPRNSKKEKIPSIKDLDEMAYWLLKEGVRTKLIINEENTTLLHKAVMDGDLPKVMALIHAGANQDVTASFKVVDGEEELSYRFNPFELAEFLGHVDIARYFSSLSLASPTFFCFPFS